MRNLAVRPFEVNSLHEKSEAMTDTPLSNPRYRNDLTAEKVRDLLDYDPESGIFTWRVDRCNGIRAGDVAGSIDGNGYVLIWTSGTGYKAHRLAWLWVTGEWPKEEIDHTNRITDDNRWVNLREATRSQNNFNISPKNRLLPRGVKRKGRKFTAEIGKPNLYLGTFDTPEEARAAYIAAAQDFYGEFYNSET